MIIKKIDGSIVLQMVVNNMNITIGFSEEPHPGIRREIANILTAAYEDRLYYLFDQFR